MCTQVKIERIGPMRARPFSCALPLGTLLFCCLSVCFLPGALSGLEGEVLSCCDAQGRNCDCEPPPSPPQSPGPGRLPQVVDPEPKGPRKPERVRKAPKKSGPAKPDREPRAAEDEAKRRARERKDRKEFQDAKKDLLGLLKRGDDLPDDIELKSGSDPEPAAEGSEAGPGLAYHDPKAKKPGVLARFWGGLRSVWSLHRKEMTPRERAALQSLKRALSGTETGKRLVSELGGWERIESEVLIRFGLTQSEGTWAYATILAPGAVKDPKKKYALVLNETLAAEPAEIVAPVLGHELSHILDFKRGHTEADLAITGEKGAHRVQIYIHLEMREGLGPARLKRLKENHRWGYMIFIADLWIDRLTERFKDKAAFSSVFAEDAYQEMAKNAFGDLKNRIVGRGSPHLDYHIEDIYEFFTDEKDVADEVEKRSRRVFYSQKQRAADEILLKEAARMEKAFGEIDRRYRRKHGHMIKGGGK